MKCAKTLGNLNDIGCWQQKLQETPFYCAAEAKTFFKRLDITLHTNNDNIFRSKNFVF